MYVMKRTDIVFKSVEGDIRINIENIKLNKVLDLFNEKILNYRVKIDNKFYNVNENEWNKLKKVYSDILEKDIIITNSFKIPTISDDVFCFLDEEDYCIVVKKLNLDNYNGDDMNYNYFIETKVKDISNTEEYEISKEVFEKVQSL